MERWYRTGRRWLARKLIAGMIVALALGGVAPRADAQQDAIDRARSVVQQWLQHRLGKPGLLLIEYTYSLTTWPNTALGCPVEGQTYVEEEVTGYRWTFLFDNLVRYEVHSRQDGSDPVLCWATSITGDVQLGLYTSPAFAILAPEAWLVFPNESGSEVLFAPQQAPTCEQPGMRVVVLGRIASSVTADQLLTERLAALGAADDPAAREATGTLGRSTVVEIPCEGAPRQLKLTVFVHYGMAYQVEQWAPAAQFDRWNGLFRNMLSQFTPGTGALSAALIQPTPPAAASAESAAPESEPVAPDGAAEASEQPESDAPPPFDPAALPPLPLAHVFVGDVFLGALNDIPGRSVTNAPAVEHRFVTFAPSGLALAFIDADTTQLRMLPVANISPRTLADNVAPDFPPAWSPDSAQIAFVAPEPDGADSTTRTLYTVPARGGTPQAAGTFAYQGGCEAPVADDPADGALMRETGPLGWRPVLEWLPGDRFLLSTGCAGGLALFDPASGQATPLGDDLRGGVLAPDRSRFAARAPGGLVIVELPGGARTDLGLGSGAGALAWAADGSALFYGTETLAERRTLEDPADQARGEAVFGVWPVTIGVYDLSLVRLDLAGPVESTLWQGQGRAIGQIAPAPDGSGVLFSVIPSSLPLAEVFQAGGDAFALMSVRPTAALFWLPRGSSVAVLLSYSGQPAFAPVTVGP